MRIAADGTTMLTIRNGRDFTAEFTSLAGVLGPALDGRAAVLDGEIVAYNQAGQVDFGLLQERRGRRRKASGSGLAGPMSRSTTCVSWRAWPPRRPAR
jgi:bifunctional non-homologous end joining protein LigD